MSKQCRRWVFTINNPTAKDMENLQNLGQDQKTKYLIFGEEKGEQGTEHIQGYMIFRNHKRFNAAKKLIGERCHLESAKGTSAENKRYCSKERKYKEYGEIVEERERTDIPKAIKRRIEGDMWNDIVDDMGAGPLYIKKAIDELVEEKKEQEYIAKLKEKYNKTTWKRWQQDLLDKIKEEPNNRSIMWYWDEDGNKGKSYLAKYIMTKGGYVSTGGKISDMVHSYKGERIFILDLSRTTEDKIPYELLENLKNGLVFSGKYNSKVKVFEVPHVIVFANFTPDITKMSRDRWDINKIE